MVVLHQYFSKTFLHLFREPTDVGTRARCMLPPSHRRRDEGRVRAEFRRRTSLQEPECHILAVHSSRRAAVCRHGDESGHYTWVATAAPTIAYVSSVAASADGEVNSSYAVIVWEDWTPTIAAVMAAVEPVTPAIALETPAIVPAWVDGVPACSTSTSMGPNTAPTRPAATPLR